MHSSKFAGDEEMQFQHPRPPQPLAWRMGGAADGPLPKPRPNAYAKDVIRADFEEAGDEVVIRKLLGDLTSAGVDVDEAHDPRDARPQRWSRPAARSSRPELNQMPMAGQRH